MTLSLNVPYFFFAAPWPPFRPEDAENNVTFQGDGRAQLITRGRQAVELDIASATVLEDLFMTYLLFG